MSLMIIFKLEIDPKDDIFLDREAWLNPITSLSSKFP